jgi:hypothetical protein
MPIVWKEQVQTLDLSVLTAVLGKPSVFDFCGICSSHVYLHTEVPEKIRHGTDLGEFFNLEMSQ